VFFTRAGSATYGSDYTIDGASDHVVIPAGHTSATITVHAMLDAARERNETIKFTLSAGNGYKLTRSGKSTTIKIVNVAH
jgi:hypothetical protein